MTRGENPVSLENSSFVPTIGVLNGLDFAFDGEDGIARGVSFWGYQLGDSQRNCNLALCHIGGFGSGCNGDQLEPSCVAIW